MLSAGHMVYFSQRIRTMTPVVPKKARVSICVRSCNGSLPASHWQDIRPIAKTPDSVLAIKDDRAFLFAWDLLRSICIVKYARLAL